VPHGSEPPSGGTLVTMKPSMRGMQRVDQSLGWFACVALQPLRWSGGRGESVSPPRRILLVEAVGAGSLQP
jgi:hypothetical protein